MEPETDTAPPGRGGMIAVGAAVVVSTLAVWGVACMGGPPEDGEWSAAVMSSGEECAENEHEKESNWGGVRVLGCASHAEKVDGYFPKAGNDDEWGPLYTDVPLGLEDLQTPDPLFGDPDDIPHEDTTKFDRKVRFIGQHYGINPDGTRPSGLDTEAWYPPHREGVASYYAQYELHEIPARPSTASLHTTTQVYCTRPKDDGDRTEVVVCYRSFDQEVPVVYAGEPPESDFVKLEEGIPAHEVCPPGQNLRLYARLRLINQHPDQDDDGNHPRWSELYALPREQYWGGCGPDSRDHRPGPGSILVPPEPNDRAPGPVFYTAVPGGLSNLDLVQDVLGDQHYPTDGSFFDKVLAEQCESPTILETWGSIGPGGLISSTRPRGDAPRSIGFTPLWLQRTVTLERNRVPFFSGVQGSQKPGVRPLYGSSTQGFSPEKADDQPPAKERLCTDPFQPVQPVNAYHDPTIFADEAEGGQGGHEHFKVVGGNRIFDDRWTAWGYQRAFMSAVGNGVSLRDYTFSTHPGNGSDYEAYTHRLGAKYSPAQNQLPFDGPVLAPVDELEPQRGLREVELKDQNGGRRHARNEYGASRVAHWNVIDYFNRHGNGVFNLGLSSDARWARCTPGDPSCPHNPLYESENGLQPLPNPFWYPAAQTTCPDQIHPSRRNYELPDPHAWRHVEFLWRDNASDLSVVRAPDHDESVATWPEVYAETYQAIKDMIAREDFDQVRSSKSIRDRIEAQWLAMRSGGSEGRLGDLEHVVALAFLSNPHTTPREYEFRKALARQSRGSYGTWSNYFEAAGIGSLQVPIDVLDRSPDAQAPGLMRLGGPVEWYGYGWVNAATQEMIEVFPDGIDPTAPELFRYFYPALPSDSTPSTHARPLLHQYMLELLVRFRAQASTAAWQSFMRKAAYRIAVAHKCGTPVIAHSGGGAVVAFLLRLIAYKAQEVEAETGVNPLKQIHAAAPHEFHVVGLEAMFTEGMVHLLTGNAGASSAGGQLLEYPRGHVYSTEASYPAEATPELVGDHPGVDFVTSYLLAAPQPGEPPPESMLRFVNYVGEAGSDNPDVFADDGDDTWLGRNSTWFDIVTAMEQLGGDSPGDSITVDRDTSENNLLCFVPVGDIRPRIWDPAIEPGAEDVGDYSCTYDFLQKTESSHAGLVAPVSQGYLHCGGNERIPGLE